VAGGALQRCGHGPAGGVGGADPDRLDVAASHDPTRSAGEQQTLWSLSADHCVDDFGQVVDEALGEDRGANLAIPVP
jgi:hypothetical protein